MKRWFSWLLALAGCTPAFSPTTTPAGVPNLVEFVPGLWRMGQPPNALAWQSLAALVDEGTRVVVIKLDDETEGDDSIAESMGWRVVRVPLVPEDDKPWTVLEVPNKNAVEIAVSTILLAHKSGAAVFIHCVHGRDRTSLISALVGRRLLGWSKDAAWKDMIAHGFRWELPGLDIFLEE